MFDPIREHAKHTTPPTPAQYATQTSHACSIRSASTRSTRHHPRQHSMPRRHRTHVRSDPRAREAHDTTHASTVCHADIARMFDPIREHAKHTTPPTPAQYA